MNKRVEMDVTTGIVREINTAPYVVDGAVVLIDADQTVPAGAMPFSQSSPPNFVPQEVSRFQGRAALIQAGHMAAIQAYIDQPTTDIMVKEAWANVTVFRRQSLMMLTVASVLNLSDEELDALFIAAHAIGDV